MAFFSTSKFSGAISEEERNINDKFLQIGKLYFEKHADDADGEFAEMISSIKVSKSKVIEYKAQIQEIKRVNRCEKCGAEVSANAVFCDICGAAIPKAEPVAAVADKNIRCSNCGAVIPNGSAFCTACGTPAVKAEEAVAEEAPAIEEAPKCTNCGAALEEGAMFCINCGTPVAKAEEPAVDAVIEEEPVVEEAPAIEETPKCTNCGAVLEEGAMFCINCGTPVAKAEEPAADAVIEEEPVVEETPVVEGTPKCTNCGAALEEDAMFCINCGTPIAKAEEPAADAVIEEEPVVEETPVIEEAPAIEEVVYDDISSLSASASSKCTNCGAVIGEGMKFCVNCGTPAPEKEKIAEEKVVSLFCTNCGAMVADGMKFCSNCGAPTNATPVQEKRCPSCGLKVEDGMVFCTECGTRL